MKEFDFTEDALTGRLIWNNHNTVLIREKRKYRLLFFYRYKPRIYRLCVNTADCQSEVRVGL